MLPLKLPIAWVLSVLTLFFGFVGNLNAQIVDIPDPNFKSALIDQQSGDIDGDGSYEFIDTNGDGEIQVSEAEPVVSLLVNHENIESLEGIESFISLETLYAGNNLLTEVNFANNTLLRHVWIAYNSIESLDFSNHPDLEVLYAESNNLSALDISGSFSLKNLRISINNLPSIDVSHLSELEVFWCSRNLLTDIDISSNANMRNFSCIETPTLESMNLQNGNNTNITFMRAYGNTNLSCILVDDEDADHPECDLATPIGWCTDPDVQLVENLADCTLGINHSNSLNKEFSLQTNPVEDELVIMANESDIKLVKVLDIRGRELMTSNQMRFNVASLVKGIYYVFVESELGRSQLIRFIKK